MVQITLLEVDLTDAAFNAPFARASGDELPGGQQMGGLGRLLGRSRGSGGGESGEDVDVEAGEFEGESPGRGMATVGAVFVLVIVGWLASRARRKRAADERVIEAT